MFIKIKMRVGPFEVIGVVWVTEVHVCYTSNVSILISDVAFCLDPSKTKVYLLFAP